MIGRHVIEKVLLGRSFPWLVGLMVVVSLVPLISQTAVACTCKPPDIAITDGMWVDKVGEPDAKYYCGKGDSSKFHIRVKTNGEIRRSYLKFDISGLSTPVVSAKLSINKTGGDGGTVGVYGLSSWSCNSAPGPAGFLDTASGPYVFDITSWVNDLISQGKDYLYLGLAMTDEPPPNPSEEKHVDFSHPCLEIELNHNPDAVDDTYATDENTQLNVPAPGVLGNDSDPDGDALTVASYDNTTAEGGTVAMNDDGSFTYDPPADFCGDDSFTYTVSDGNGGTDTATVAITVNCVADCSSYQVDFLGSSYDGANTNFAYRVAASDDPAISHWVLALPTCIDEADIEAAGPGTWEFGTDPTTGARGIKFETSINAGESVDFYVTLTGSWHEEAAQAAIKAGQLVCFKDTVGPSCNQPPVAVDDSYTTDENTQLNVPAPGVLGNDSDPDGDALTVESYDSTTVKGGSVSMNSDGSFTYDPPADSCCGDDSFTYTVSDGHGGTDTATVSITVNCTCNNNSPVANDDTASTLTNTPVDIDVLANDSDPDGDPLIVVSVTQPSHGTVVNNGDGVTYTPDTDYCGDDSFTYTISDDGHCSGCQHGGQCGGGQCGGGGQCDGCNPGTSTATVYVTVICVADLEVAKTCHDLVAGEADQLAYTITVTNHGPSAADGVSLSDELPAGLSNATYSLDGGAKTAWSSPLDLGTMAAGTSHTIEIYADVDPGLTGTLSNTATVSSDTSEPAQDQYPNSDTCANTVTSQTDLEVVKTDATDPVVAGEDLSYKVTVTNHGPSDATGVEVTETLPDGVSYVSATPSQGSYDPGSGVWSVGDLADGASATLTLVVSVDSVTTATITNTVCVSGDQTDPNGDNNCDDEETSVTPLITIDDVTVTEGVDADAVFTITLSNPSASDVTVNYATADNTAVQPGDYTAVSGTATIPAGSLSTTVSVPIVDDTVSEPTEDFYVNLSGASNANITDSQGVGTILDDDIANNPPVAVDDDVITDEDTSVTIPVLGNDSDPDGDTLTVTGATAGTNGTTIVNPDGTITYTPDPNYCGQDSFTYSISDGRGGTDTATVSVTVNCVNDPPVALDDTATTNADTAVTIEVLANDSDPDGTVDPATVTISTPPSGGSVIVNADGTITYHPDPGFNGVDTFTYTVDDNEGLTSNIATVSVTVVSAGADLAVVKTADNIAPNEGDTVNFTITVTNNGPDDATGVTVTDLLPVGLTYSSDTGGGAYNPATGLWTVGALAAGADATLTITATVNAGTGGSTITNTASATGDQPDPDTTNNTGSVDLTVGVFVAGGGGGAAQECEGKVIISEVAWAGTAASPQDEWIELRNLGTTPVDLTGWTIRWRKKNPVTPDDYRWKVVELSGTILPAPTSACELAAQEGGAPVKIVKRPDDNISWLVVSEAEKQEGNGYFLLERRSDKTVSDIPAGLIYDTTPPYPLDLDDDGDVIELLNDQGEIVDTANASPEPRNGWPAGDPTIHATMERIDPLGPDSPDNWYTNMGIITYGLDANGRPLVATADLANVDVLSDLALENEVVPAKTRAGARLEVGIDLPREARKTGWPWIRVTRPGVTEAAGGGGGVIPYSFSSRYAHDIYWLGIDTSNLPPGKYNFWIVYGEGKVILVPVEVLP